jgi:hypothetical protein
MDNAMDWREFWGTTTKPPAKKNPRPKPGAKLTSPWEAAGAAAPARAQTSTFTETVETRWALGARTLSRPSR